MWVMKKVNKARVREFIKKVRVGQLQLSYSGEEDIVAVDDGQHTVMVSFYELQYLISRPDKLLPPRCPTCRGIGKVAFPSELEPRSLVTCHDCLGTRIKSRTPPSHSYVPAFEMTRSPSVAKIAPEVESMIRRDLLRSLVPPEPAAGIPMLLTCPSQDCGKRHLDVGVFATKPHHTHACQHCGMVWRPALVPTVGVEFLPGYKNEPAKDGKP